MWKSFQVANRANPEFDARLNTWQTLLNQQNADEFLENATDFSQTFGPAGEDGDLTEFNQLFVIKEMQNVWSDPIEYASNRLACDPRLEETAKICFYDAFTADGNLNGDNFCAHIPFFFGYNLDDVQTRQWIK